MRSALSVPFGDMTREARELSDLLKKAVYRVIDGGWFILGPEVEGFEEEFARWLDIPHVVGVASGTEAITLALLALGVGAGDEVITAANTCVPTAAGIAGCGASIRLADCETGTLMISPESVEAAITSKTRAIVPVHLYGNCADMVQLRKIADHHGLFLVEDCAQAVGSLNNGQAAGTLGDANAFSFYPTKNLGAYGDGGCVSTANPEIAERLRSIRNYGYQQRDYSIKLGLNSRLDAMQAAILRTKLPFVDSWNKRRADIAQRYQDGLQAYGLELPTTRESVVNAFHLFPVLVEDRDGVRDRLQQVGVQALVHYPTPLHLQPALANLGYEPGEFPNAEWACSHILSLPMYPQLRDEEADWVIESLSQAIRDNR